MAAPSTGCREAAPATAPAPALTAPEPRNSDGRAQLLECLGAPRNAIFDPKRLAAPPVDGLSVHTFEQPTADCGTVTRRYLVYVPKALGAETTAPVVIVLHGQGASAEAMRGFQTRGTFDALAAREGFIVVYGNGLPTKFNLLGLPNSGRWRSEYTELGETVDEVEYLERIVQDLIGRRVIAEGNDVYLVGQSNGGGMALSAARQRPHSYAGVAAFMPFVGFSPSPPADLAGTRLARVLLVHSLADPMLPSGYSHRVLEPLARGWARALGVAGPDVDAPKATKLPDLVVEHEAGDSDHAIIESTRDSSVVELDFRSQDSALRQLVFDRAGHFWPTRTYEDPLPVLMEAGLRNQDVEGAEISWRFFRE